MPVPSTVVRPAEPRERLTVNLYQRQVVVLERLKRTTGRPVSDIVRELLDRALQEAA